MIIISAKFILILFSMLLVLWKIYPVIDRLVIRSIKNICLFMFYRSFGACNSKGVLIGRYQVARKAAVAEKHADSVVEPPKSIQPKKSQNSQEPKNRRVSHRLVTAGELETPTLWPRNPDQTPNAISRYPDEADLSTPAYLRSGKDVELDIEHNTFTIVSAA
ncbi:hypothetical protein L1D14_10635 [Vibrio tubiashii]|uniref:hypothetical protein n=1 Tax=Vibrio tubiashii TaxID=29498 RepID=UPI001EFD36E1|nr:hypothetical protein [Vibrio tubiashii]MCG9576694.1 hypothetical protein [Vibrio tubiashii]